jgi:hydrogenase maturation protease
MVRTLVIGYGNPSRRDDGAGLAVVNGLRSRLGLPDLDETTDGFADLGHTLDTLFVQQLTPELADTLTGYERLLLVDAHAGAYPDLVHWTPLVPRYDPAMVSHIVKPAHLLALAEQYAGRSPEAVLVSIRGEDFDFGLGLSAETARGVQQVIAHIWEETVTQNDQ